MKTIFKAFATVSAVSVITRVCSFFFKIFLSRALGAEILGLYQIALSLLMLFACFGSSGLPVTVSRLTAEYNTLNDKLAQRGIVTTSMLISVMFSGVTITLFMAFPQLLDMLFADKRCTTLFVIMLPMLMTTSVYSIIRGWFWGTKDFFTFSATEFFDEILKIIFAVILFCGAIPFVNKTYAYAYSMVIGDILLVVGLVAYYFHKGERFARPTHLGEIARSATPLTITRIFGSLMSTFLSLSIPLFLVNKFGLTTAQATAEFGRASGMVMPLIFTPTSVIGSLSVVLIPEIATLKKQKNSNSLSNKINQTIKLGAIVSCFFIIIFFSCGQEICEMLYKDSVAGKYLEVASILMLPMCVNNVLISLLNSLGQEKKTFASHIIGCVVLFVVAITTPKFIGIYAYFLSLVAFHSVVMVLNLFALRKEIKLDKKSLVQNVVTCVATATIALLAKLSNNFFAKFLSPWYCIILTTLIGSITFVLFVTCAKILDLSFFSKIFPRKKRLSLCAEK
ncbi:MAG: oligosaccharide flippase family protein [Clostridia bacterium]